MVHAGFEAKHLILILLSKLILCPYILVRLLLKEQFFEYIEEGIRVEI